MVDWTDLEHPAPEARLEADIHALSDPDKLSRELRPLVRRAGDLWARHGPAVEAVEIKGAVDGTRGFRALVVIGPDYGPSGGDYRVIRDAVANVMVQLSLDYSRGRR